MNTPIIIPVVYRDEIDCIIQDGVRYCEKTNVSPSFLGWAGLSALALFIWIGFWVWVSEKYFDDSVAVILGIGLGLPILIGSLYLLNK